MIDLPLSAAEAGKDALSQWGLPIVAMVTIIYVVFIRPMSKKKDPLERKPSTSNLSQQRALERDMSNVLVQYEQMIRQMTAGVDTRAARLEALIADADRRIAELQRLQRSVAARDRMSPDDRPADASHPSHDGAANHSAPAEPEPSPIVEEFIDPRHAEVYALADEGVAAREIAQRLNRPGGEVELILALRPPSRRPTGVPLA